MLATPTVASAASAGANSPTMAVSRFTAPNTTVQASSPRPVTVSRDAAPNAPSTAPSPIAAVRYP